MPEPRPDHPTAQGLAFLGAVAGGLVHEIRNPLSTMNVTLQLLQEDWPEGEGAPKDVKTARRIKTLRGEVQRLEAILDDFLRYAGIRRLDLAQADLNRILEEVVGFLRPDCERAGIDLRLYPDRNLPLMSVDERLIKQCLLNLMLNAVQAMEGARERAGGEDSAADGDADQLIIRCRQEGETVRVDVIDTGPGIAPEDQLRVWEVYFSRKKTGSGLGLPTARRIAEEHGGSLDLASEPGKGTDFILRLPLSGPPRDERVRS